MEYNNDGGPSDFTENILFYLGDDAPKVPTITQPTALLDSSRRTDLEDYVSGEEPFSSSPDARNSPSHHFIDNKAPQSPHPMSPQSSPGSPELVDSPSPLQPDYNLSPTRPRPGRPISSGPPRSRGSQSRKPVEGVKESDTVKALENSLKLLRAELESVRQQSAVEIKNLQTQFKWKSTAQELEEAKSQQLELDGLSAEIGRLRLEHHQDVERLKTQNEQQMQQQQALEAENARLKAERERNIEQLNRSRAETAELKNNVKESTRFAGTTIQTLKTDHLSIIEGLKEEHNMLLQAQSAQADMRISELEEQVSDAQDLASQRLQGIRKFETEISELKNQCVIANDRADDMERERDGLEKEKAAELEKIDKLAASWERKVEVIAKLKKQVADTTQSNVELGKELNVFRRKLAAVEIESKGVSASHAKELASMRQESEKRGKMLLQYWGRSECGAAPNGSRQPYKYMVHE